MNILLHARSFELIVIKTQKTNDFQQNTLKHMLKIKKNIKKHA